MLKNSDTTLSSQDSEITILADATTPASMPDPETWWEHFRATMSLHQLEEMQRLAIEGKTDPEIMQHFKSKQISEEERWLGVIQYAEEERRKYNKENRAQRRHQRQLEEARKLAEWHRIHGSEDPWAFCNTE